MTKVFAAIAFVAFVGLSAYLYPVAVVAAVLLGASTGLAINWRVAVVLVGLLVLLADLGLRVDASESWVPPTHEKRR